MATGANSAVSFQGLSTGIQTDALVSAILAQEGQGLTALQKRQTSNTAKTTALTAMQSSINDLNLSLATLQDQFNSRVVTSTDTTSTYVTATASGAASGNYDLQVSTIATKGQISPVQGSTLSVADPTAAIFSSSQASFAVQGTDGVTKTFQLTNNSLNGLRDAINASGAGVNATVVNTGSGTNPYMLVVAASTTGTGTTGGIVTLAAISNSDASATTLISSAGVTLGAGLSGGITGTFAAPTGITGGMSSTAAKDAVFTLNGIQLTRQTNQVTDAADGVTFTLKQGGETGITTLTVAPNTTAAATGMQAVLTKFNALLTAYQTASTVTRNADGSINSGPLTGEPTSRSIITQLRSALTGNQTSVATNATFPTLASLGVRTNADGSLTMSTAGFQVALAKDPNAALGLVTAVSQSLTTLTSNLTASGTGPLSVALMNIQTQNQQLAVQIQSAQSALDRRKQVLQLKFSTMESTVAEMKAAASSLTGA